MIRLLGIAGRKGAGKDAVGAILRREHGYRTLAYADPLKRIARDLYGLTRDQADGPIAVKELVDPRWGLSPREIMQRLGTEVARSIHPETWTCYALARIDEAPGAWAITDVRFPNEADCIRSRGGFVLLVERPGYGTGAHEGHASERVEEVPADIVIRNVGDLAALALMVASALASLSGRIDR